jgi:transcriptional regulator with XRE-family HTH domain
VGLLLLAGLRAKQSGETMGQRLKRLREAAGLSQSQLARAAGVTLGALRNWEHDRREPLVSAAARLAKAMGCTMEDIVGPVQPPKVKEPPPKKRGRPPKEK